MGCPEGECKLEKSVEGHHRTLYGPDGRQGLSGDVANLKNNKADKNMLERYMKKPKTFAIAIFIGAIFIPSVIMVINIWAQQKINPYEYAKKETSIKNEMRITQLENAVQEIKNDVDKIEKRNEIVTKALEEIANYIKGEDKPEDEDG